MLGLFLSTGLSYCHQFTPKMQHFSSHGASTPSFALCWVWIFHDFILEGKTHWDCLTWKTENITNALKSKWIQVRQSRCNIPSSFPITSKKVPKLSLPQNWVLHLEKDQINSDRILTTESLVPFASGFGSAGPSKAKLAFSKLWLNLAPKVRLRKDAGKVMWSKLCWNSSPKVKVS